MSTFKGKYIAILLSLAVISCLSYLENISLIDVFLYITIVGVPTISWLKLYYKNNYVLCISTIIFMITYNLIFSNVTIINIIGVSIFSQIMYYNIASLIGRNES